MTRPGNGESKWQGCLLAEVKLVEMLIAGRHFSGSQVLELSVVKAFHPFRDTVEGRCELANMTGSGQVGEPLYYRSVGCSPGVVW
jgi:hypothetical protein